MQRMSAARRVSQVFLWAFLLVPMMIFILGDGRSKLYLIGGSANGIAMLIAAWVLGARAIRGAKAETRWAGIAGLLFIASMVMVSMFAGLGPPPDDGPEWLATAWDQTLRYTLLLFSGLSVAAGFRSLKECLREAGEHFYSGLGFSAIIVSVTLYVIYITGFTTFAVGAMRQEVALGQRPDWVMPVSNHITVIGLVEVSLTYLATAAFAAAMRSVEWLGTTASRVFVAISLLAAPLVALSPFYGTTFGLPIFPLAIPAVPFIMPYLIGISLLKRVGDQTQ